MSLSIGSLCSGYGGLDLAIETALDAHVTWVAEVDPDASHVLAHHWPEATNHGDITTVDWAAVEPVDIIAGGTPCQDLSLAGARAGMTTETRSGLWSHMRDAIEAIRPHLPTPRASDGAHGGPAQRDAISGAVHAASLSGVSTDAIWGWTRYLDAILRHETALGRTAPPPTVDTPRGHRLNPRFVEWMMMLPDGWVTDHTMPRRRQLTILGNGVVPAQAAAALHDMRGAIPC